MTSKQRGYLKIFILIGIAVIVGGALFFLGSEPKAIDELKISLSLWSVILMLFCINIVSFLSFLLLHSCYKWIKKDFEIK